MEISRYRSGAFKVNCYVIEEKGHFLIIDPILTDELRDTIGNGVVDLAILTHEHYDHILSVNEISSENMFPVYCGHYASIALGDSRKNLSRYSEFLLECIPFADKTSRVRISDYSCKCDNVLRDGEVLSWQGHEIYIKETPGHSKGSICILLDNENLFSGDTVFSMYETALRLPGGSRKDYNEITLKWLDSLPQETMVFPGHTDSFQLKNRYSAKDSKQ